jgi:hypothetical protein
VTAKQKLSTLSGGDGYQIRRCIEQSLIIRVGGFRQKLATFSDDGVDFVDRLGDGQPHTKLIKAVVGAHSLLAPPAAAFDKRCGQSGHGLLHIVAQHRRRRDFEELGIHAANSGGGLSGSTNNC